MKQAIPSRGGSAQTPAGPVSAGRQQQRIASSGGLAQLATMMNSGPRTQALTQLQTSFQHSARVQGLNRMSSEMHRDAPAQLQEVPQEAHDEPDSEAARNSSLPTIGSSAVVQRFQVEQAPEDREIYSRSNDKKLVTGMHTPNHDFLVNTMAAYPVMNGVMKDSPLEVFSRGKKKLFGQTMSQVGLQYKRSRLKDEARKEQIKRGTVKKDFWESENRGDLQAQYEKNVLPNVYLYRENITKETLADIEASGFNKAEIAPILQFLSYLMTSVNLFKTVFNAELANTGEFNKRNQQLAAVGLGLLRTVEYPLYKADLTKEDLRAAKQSFLETWFDEDDRDNPNLISQIVYRILDGLTKLIKVFPKGKQANMILFQKYNFNQELLQKLLSKDNLVLYRACDAQASTLLGNKVTPENQPLLKSYSAGVDAQLHYATKILTSGADWVTLEHFAASQLERRISGTETARAKNMDHTWQYIMQGSHPSAKEGVSNEDKYFEIYTKIRYYLRGLVEHQKGTFNLNPREKLQDAEARRFIQLSGSSQMANVVGWHAFYNHIASAEEEDKLFVSLNQLEAALYSGEDPLVHAKESWDNLMAWQK